jgi:hypothetical protein
MIVLTDVCRICVMVGNANVATSVHSASAMADDEFAGSDPTGYKAPKQASLDEMKSKDADDEALNRWKASLLKNGVTPSHTRTDRHTE